MKSDARLLLNKKRWRKESGSKEPIIYKARSGVDARKILNFKRSRKEKPTVLGSYMRTKSTTDLIASHITKEISPVYKVPDKLVKLSQDGNLIITSNSKMTSKVIGRKEGLPKMNVSTSSRSTLLEQESMQFESSNSDIDDLEHTAVGDLLDFESLPPALVATKSVPVQLPKHTMVADQIAEYSGSRNAKVCASNLHPSVSRKDVMELFGDVGIIRNVDMLMPGTAVIHFYDEDDASKACEVYHNRLLDGIPMKCYLQGDGQQQKSAISHRLGERMEPFPDSAHKVISPPVITNSRSRYNPRNVQFTVKLT